jgi:hypothetical protein
MLSQQHNTKYIITFPFCGIKNLAKVSYVTLEKLIEFTIQKHAFPHFFQFFFVKLGKNII